MNSYLHFMTCNMTLVMSSCPSLRYIYMTLEMSTWPSLPDILYMTLEIAIWPWLRDMDLTLGMYMYLCTSLHVIWPLWCQSDLHFMTCYMTFAVSIWPLLYDMLYDLGSVHLTFLSLEVQVYPILIFKSMEVNYTYVPQIHKRTADLFSITCICH